LKIIIEIENILVDDIILDIFEKYLILNFEIFFDPIVICQPLKFQDTLHRLKKKVLSRSDYKSYLKMIIEIRYNYVIKY